MASMTLTATTTSRPSVVEVPLPPLDTAPHKPDHSLSISSLKSTPVQNGSNVEEDPYMPTDESILPSSLPPVDGGRQAWAYLLCATILETLVWGELELSGWVVVLLIQMLLLLGLPLSYGGTLISLFLFEGTE